MIIFFRGGVCSKKLILQIMAEDLNGLGILPWVTKVRPDFGLRFSLGPFLHTTLIVDMRWTIIAQVKIYLSTLTPPLPPKKGHIWWSILKNADFAKNGQKPKRTRYSSMSNQSTTGFCSPFPSRTFPSYLTHCRYEVNNHSSSLNEPEPIHPPPQTKGHIWWKTPLPRNILSLSTVPIGTIY